MRKRKLQIRIFKSHEEQERADTKFWRSISSNKKMKLYEDFFYNYLMLQYGKIPRLQRHINITKRKKS